MTMLRAIETQYKGYRFRSRLEARWAVFFDALDLKWEYEPEGFVTDAGPYLPDFRVWTPQGKPMWYEVKPSGVAKDPKFDAFRFALPKTDAGEYARAELLSGDPVDFLRKKTDTFGESQCGSVCPLCGVLRAAGRLARVRGEVAVWCTHCGDECVAGGPRWGHDRISCGAGVLGYEVSAEFYFMMTTQAFLDRAYAAMNAARSARFEHGEHA